MRRRSFLGLVSGSIAGIAGCTGTIPRTNASGTVGLPVSSDVDEVVWTDSVADASNSVRVEATVSESVLPDVRATFRFVNDGDRTVTTNFYSWRLYRKTETGWHYVDPMYTPQPAMMLGPGRTHAWSLTASHDPPDVLSAGTSGAKNLHVQPIGGGTYAFAINGWFEDEKATPRYEHQTVWATEFSVEGPQLSLVPSGTVDGSSRQADVVEVDARLDDPSDALGAATFVLTRDPDATEARSLITEEVYRRWPLRDALAHAGPGVDEIRVRTHTSTTPAFGINEDTAPVEYQETTWTPSAEDVEPPSWGDDES